MANLLGSSIEPNYRGILNLGDTINQPLSGTLQSVTDGMGNNSPLSLSTTVVGIGRTGADGLVHWRRSADGNSAAAMGVRPGFSDWYFEGNNVNFRTNSTGFFFGGGSTWVTPTARLHVRGDGTNPVARFESTGGANIVGIRESDHTLFFGTGSTTFPQIGLQNLNNPISFANGNGHYLAYKANVNIDWPSPMHSFWGENQIYSKTTLSNNPAGIAAFNGTFGISNVAASTFDYRMLSINYTINNTAVSNRTATGIFLNATQTNLNGMTHNLMDLQVNNGSSLRVNNSGSIFNPTGGNYNNGQYGSLGRGFITFTLNGVARLDNASENDFNRLQFGGNTNLFPALKRVGTNLEVRLADDSNFTGLTADIITTSGPNSYIVTGTIFSGAVGTTRFGNALGVGFSAGGNNASAIVDIRSTTRGFLPPRMTTAERDAIASPAAGLMIYNTTTNKLSVFTTIWETITSA